MHLDYFCQTNHNIIHEAPSAWRPPYLALTQAGDTHLGISQEKLPLYLDFFEFVHNIRRRGKSVLSALLTLLLAT